MHRTEERVLPVYIEDEMRTSYLDYAMSVIVGRALPDVRDGLKPVHRRILYAMNGLGLLPEKPYKKSARVVGEVLGKFHPHGDAAVYEAIVRMAQDFSLRHPLIDGQGNFGSIDGDEAAAMRYTEVRLGPLSMELLRDIEKETVDFVPNFDNTLEEPTVLPASFPNLMVNGSSGIAVGMATNIPPHNLNEVVDAIIMVIENPDVEIDSLMEVILGPDFPTGGFILRGEGLREAYLLGKGRVIVRARAIIEKARSGKESIIIKEIPYQVNKSALIKKIAELVQEKRISGIVGLRDESDRDGMRIVIELKRDEAPHIILNCLYKHTQLQTTFGITMLALVDGAPRILNLKEMLVCFLDHRIEVVRRRTQYELKVAEERAHILEGLKVAIANLDRIIKIIRGSATPSDAKDELVRVFGLSEQQAQAILDMPLKKLTRLEHKQIEDEYLELIKKIAFLKSVLASERKILEIIKQELISLKERYGNERRSELLEEEGDFEAEDLIKEEEVVITVSHTGYIKRLPLNTYRQQRRGGRGVVGMTIKEEDFVKHIFVGSTHSFVLCFTNLGRLFWLKIHEVPEGGRLSKGKALVNLLNLRDKETVTAFIPINDFDEGRYLLMVTACGVIKKTPLRAFSNPRARGIVALSLGEGDELVGVRLTSGEDDIILATSSGRALRFNERTLRPMGRAARGVRGIRLFEGHRVVGMEVVVEGLSLFTLTSNGCAKRTRLENYPIHNRGGCGVIDIKIKDHNTDVVAIHEVGEEDELVVITNNGLVIRIPIKEIPILGRNTQGVRLIRLEKEDRVVGCALVTPRQSPP
jgi:DNA gyrase subunit A